METDKGHMITLSLFWLSFLIKQSLLFQVNFLEDSLRTEDSDKGDTNTRTKGAKKPLTTFKGQLLDVR